MLLIFTVPLAYAESGFQEPVDGIIDSLGGTLETWTKGSDLSDERKENIQKILGAGTETGHAVSNLWFKAHDLFVELIFTGSHEAGVQLTYDVIIWISMLVVLILTAFFIKRLFKDNAKLAIIVIGIILFLGFIGVVVEF